MALPPIYMDKSTAGDDEDFEDTDRELQDLVRLEVPWTSSLGSAGSLCTRGGCWWLFSQLLRYSFCGICRNELEGLALVARGQKSLFSSLSNPLQPLLLYWCSDTQKGHLGCCSSLYDSPVLLWPGLYSGLCVGTHEMDVSPSSPSLGNILESYSVTLWMAPETRANQTKVLVVRN